MEHDLDDPPPSPAWDFWDYFNRHCENLARWLRSLGFM